MFFKKGAYNGSNKQKEGWNMDNPKPPFAHVQNPLDQPSAFAQGMEKALLLSILQQDTITDEQYEQCIRLLNHKNMPVFTDE